MKIEKHEEIIVNLIIGAALTMMFGGLIALVIL